MTLQPIAFCSVNKQGDITRTVKRADAWSKVPLYFLTAEQAKAAGRVLESTPLRVAQPGQSSRPGPEGS